VADPNYLNPRVASDARDLFCRLLEADADVYRRAVDVLSGFGHALPEDAPGRLYAVWGALTDRWELEPEQRPETERVMRDAAREFVAVTGSPCELDGYLTRWCERLRIPG
jgi:hypothetical protein